MKVIQSWSDAAEFAGKPVAYETNSGYFAANDNSGYILKDESVTFGYVLKESQSWNNQQMGYRLLTVLKPNRVDHTRAMIDEKLNQKWPGEKISASLTMRLATDEERSLIITAISNEEAEIGSLISLNKERMIAFFLEKSTF